MRGDAIVYNQRLITQAVYGIAHALEQGIGLQITPVTFAELPASPQLGMIACVSDHNGGMGWGSSVVGGGSAKVLAWYNGTNWTVIGI